ncbi:MAG: SEL1-like repeat protein [Synergistaceae bacterium]|nr:SEL1-like repeat protein [Synergistaceae bacterium]
MRKIALTVISLLVLASPLHASDYDPQLTMSALNMAVVSVHRIITTQSRAVLDDEYQNIINNLNLGNIRSDPEITSLYEKLLDITGRKKLRSEEADYLRKNYNAAARKSISGALSDLGKSSVSVIRENGSIGAFFGSFSNLVSVSAASYFKYQYGGLNLQGTLEDNLYRLKAEDLADFNDLQKELLTSSWNLMNKYSLPDEYRLVQKSVEDFCRAVEKTEEPSRKLRMLQAMESDFRVYPPYWFYRAKAAQEARDSEETAKCYDKFEEVWRPVLRKDPYMLETAKYRISRLVDDSLPTDYETREQILGLCQIMRENTLREDWVNNLFAGAVYYALDEKDEGIRCAEINIDFGYEHELSEAVLQNMRLNVPAGLLLRETQRSLKLDGITSGMTSRDKFRVIMIADCLDNRDGAAERLALPAKSAAELHALRVSLVSRTDTEAFPELVRIANTQPVSGDELSRDYALIMPLLKVYSDDENAQAFTMLADMHLYGWKVSQDSELAMSYYLKAAEKGNIYAQFMYINLLTASRSDYDDEPEIVIVNDENAEPFSPEVKPKREKKPLLRFWPFKR